MTKEELIDFEQEIADLFEQGRIKAPVHLSGNNEDDLIEIFKHIQKDDWVFSTHRSHYHALLKGVPKEKVKNEILLGHSITLNFAEYKFFSSAIVGSCLPVAVGVAMGGQNAWVFIGDMAAHSGIFHECQQYASGHNLPVYFVIEDNGKSVCTPTKEVWGTQNKYSKLRYVYENKWPHQGMGKWVTF